MIFPQIKISLSNFTLQEMAIDHSLFTELKSLILYRYLFFEGGGKTPTTPNLIQKLQVLILSCSIEKVLRKKKVTLPSLFWTFQADVFSPPL